VQLKLTENEL